jgi:hypothetical protein
MYRWKDYSCSCSSAGASRESFFRYRKFPRKLSREPSRKLAGVR